MAETIKECKRIGIPVLPPDINESFSQFTVVKEGEGLRMETEEKTIIPAPTPTSPTYRIRFGLVTIKNFGQGISTAIIDERKKNGKFKSLADFLNRVKDRNLNKKSLESLIKAGALDCFGEDRGVLLANIDLMLDYNKENANVNADQNSLFSMMADSSSVPTLKLNPAPTIEMADRLAWEKELLGLYVSGHPLEKYRTMMEKKEMNIKKALETAKEGSSVIFAAIINEVRLVQTKNNETMAFIAISDFTGSSEAVVFPRTYKEFQSLIVVDKCLAIKANVNTRNGEKGFILDRVKGL